MTKHDVSGSVLLFGTRWPVPAGWQPDGKGGFVGPGGILALDSYEGMLVDPNRRSIAMRDRPGTWKLVRCHNGLALYGRMTEGRSQVLQWIVRSEVPAGEEWLFPEVQATYVLGAEAAGLVEPIETALGTRVIADDELGELDEYGHGAAGPVPVLTDWVTVDEPGSPAPYGFVPARATVSLIGGGVIALKDPAGCCRMVLSPLPLARVTPDAAAAWIRRAVRDPDLQVSADGARVWTWVLAREGCSFELPATATRARIVGAAWADPFGQGWQLRYTLSPEHASSTERDLRSAT